MTRSLFLLITLFQLICGLAMAGEFPEINFDKVAFRSSRTQSGAIQFVNGRSRLTKTAEEAGGETNQMLTGTVWRWQETLDRNSTRTVPPNPENYLLNFLPDRKISIRADCNLGGGFYKWDGSEISIEITYTTRAACPPESLEGRYIQDLNAAAHYRIEGDSLFIDLKQDKGTMKFRRGT